MKEVRQPPRGPCGSQLSQRKERELLVYRSLKCQRTDERANAKNAPMFSYGFDQYQGRLFRVFEGTLLEGVVTNHIDGGLSGHILMMLATDDYSHDHQRRCLVALLPARREKLSRPVSSDRSGASHLS